MCEKIQAAITTKNSMMPMMENNITCAEIRTTYSLFSIRLQRTSGSYSRPHYGCG
jgi:hypothetical protein